MSGRSESDEKIYRRIEYKLTRMPPYVTEWYYHLKANEMKASSCYDYINKVYQFMYFISWARTFELEPEELTIQKLDQYMINIKTKEKNGQLLPTSDAYRTSVWTCLNNFFDFLYTREYLPCNYMEKAGLKKPKINDEIKRIHLTKEDFSNIISVVTEDKENNPYKCRDTAILLLFMTTGMRKTALDNINVSDINLSDSEINEVEITDKGERKHHYILTDQTKKALNDWLDMRCLLLKGLDNDALFISSEGKRISSNGIYKIVKKWTKKALGYELSPHKLRGGFITIMIDETGDIMATSEAVGHKNVRTTQRYYAQTGRGKKMAASIMEDL